MDAQTLAAALPGLSQAKADEYVKPMNEAMNHWQINNLARARMFLAQVGHESVSLMYMEEIASGAEYNGRADLGNTQPGDGPRFKGRGPIQLTGRANYTACGRALGIDFVDHPEWVAEPEYAFLTTGWWWYTHGLNQISDTGSVQAATLRINGGYNGLADREARYQHVCTLGTRVLPGPPPPPPDPHHYDFYPNEAFTFKRKDGSTFTLNERATVQSYDHLWAAKEHNMAQIEAVRGHVMILRDRVWKVAHMGSGGPHWNDSRRLGWRWQRLNERLKGAVKV